MRRIKKRKGEKGTITVETAIMLPIFFFMFLALFGVFFLLIARHQMRHAFTQTAKSLSMDSYIMESVSTVGVDGNLFYNSFGELATAFIRWIISDDYYTARTKWYETSNSSTGQEIIKKRFVGFLAGGDEAQADSMLKELRVKNGLSGVEFEYYVSGGEMTITMKYTLDYWFKFFGLEEIPMSQTLKMKMWGYDGGSGGAP